MGDKNPKKKEKKKKKLKRRSPHQLRESNLEKIRNSE